MNLAKMFLSKCSKRLPVALNGKLAKGTLESVDRSPAAEQSL